MLDRNAIKNVNDRKTATINVPEWGGDVYIRKWSGKDRSMFFQKSIKGSNEAAELNWDTLFENMTLVVALSLCDENGVALFTTKQEDIDILASKDGDVIQKIYQESLILNGLAKRSLEDAAKNLNPVQKENSISV